MPRSSRREPRATTIATIDRDARAERHPHADFLPLLRDRRRHHAVDADHREHEPDRRKHRQQDQVEARSRELVFGQQPRRAS